MTAPFFMLSNKLFFSLSGLLFRRTQSFSALPLTPSRFAVHRQEVAPWLGTNFPHFTAMLHLIRSVTVEF